MNITPRSARHGFARETKSLSNRNDDFPNLLVRLHVAMGGDDVLHCKRLVDARFEPSTHEVIENVVLGLGEGDRVADEFEQRIPLDGQMLPETGKERIRSR